MEEYTGSPPDPAPAPAPRPAPSGPARTNAVHQQTEGSEAKVAEIARAGAQVKAQLEQNKLEMAEILGHAENLSRAVEDLVRPTLQPGSSSARGAGGHSLSSDCGWPWAQEAEVAALQQENAALRGGAGGGHGSPGGRTASPVGITRARVAAGLGGSPPLIAVQNGGATVAAQLGMVARRLRAEEARGDREEAEAVSEQLSALATLLESAAQELHQKSEDVATEREAHDVTAHRLAMLQKKYAVMELRDSVAEDVRGERTSSPIFDRQPIAHRSPGPGGGGGSPKHDAPASASRRGDATSGGAGGRRRPRPAAARRPAPEESKPADDWDDRSDELDGAGAEPTRQQRWASARGPARDHSAPPAHHRSAPPAAVRRAPSPQSTARRRSSAARRPRPRGRPASNPRAYAPSSLRRQQPLIE